MWNFNSLFLVSHLRFLFIPCGRLSWLPVSFLLHIKYTLSYRKKNDFIEAVHRSWVDAQRRYVHSTLLRSFHVHPLTWFLGLRYFFITCNIEYLLPIIWRKCLFCLHHCKIWCFLSIIVIVRAGVKSTNVVCPRNETYDFCIFAIFSKTGFVDIKLCATNHRLKQQVTSSSRFLLYVYIAGTSAITRSSSGSRSSTEGTRKLVLVCTLYIIATCPELHYRWVFTRLSRDDL